MQTQLLASSLRTTRLASSTLTPPPSVTIRSSFLMSACRSPGFLPLTSWIDATPNAAVIRPIGAESAADVVEPPAVEAGALAMSVDCAMATEKVLIRALVAIATTNDLQRRIGTPHLLTTTNGSFARNLYSPAVSQLRIRAVRLETSE